MTVSSPAEGLEFICQDDTPTFALDFRAIDAETGQPIEQTWTIVWQGDPLDDIRLNHDWESGLYKGVPEGVPLRWILRAADYRLATGDESDFRSEGELRVLEARLRPGWGQVFKVTTREDDPIPDVELVVDGESVGYTDAQGMVSMNLDAKPKSLEFRYEGWHVSGGCVDPDEEGFSWGAEDLVYLSPDQ